jgi:hypothetical protein
MRVFKIALMFCVCLFGGAVLASVIHVVGATLYSSPNIFHNYQSLETHVTILAHAHPIAAVIGAFVGALIFFRGKQRSTSSSPKDYAH